MEVIHKYNLSQWQTDVYCEHCFSETMIKSEDILFNKKVRYHLHYNYLEDYFYVHCPVCNVEVEVDAYLMPGELQRQISSKYKVVVPEKKTKWGMWVLVTSPLWIMSLLLSILYIVNH